jgi:hypothetical protein
MSIACRDFGPSAESKLLAQIRKSSKNPDNALKISAKTSARTKVQEAEAITGYRTFWRSTWNFAQMFADGLFCRTGEARRGPDAPWEHTTVWHMSWRPRGRSRDLYPTFKGQL